jgi:predicted regulator of amino acid metabolism with ACT domain
MTEGWIALHRKIYNSKDFGNQLEVAVFLYLVAMASHKPVQVIYRKKKLTLKRGEVSIAYKDLAKKFDISERKVRGIIKNLVHTRNLNQTLHKNLSIYTIVKYSKYQDVPVKTDQTLTDRTTTIYTNTTSIDKNKISLSSMTNKPKKIQIPLLQSLKTAIIEKPREKNEYEIMKERLDAEDYEKWVLRQLNS